MVAGRRVPMWARPFSFKRVTMPAKLVRRLPKIAAGQVRVTAVLLTRPNQAAAPGHMIRQSDCPREHHAGRGGLLRPPTFKTPTSDYSFGHPLRLSLETRRLANRRPLRPVASGDGRKPDGLRPGIGWALFARQPGLILSDLGMRCAASQRPSCGRAPSRSSSQDGGCGRCVSSLPSAVVPAYRRWIKPDCASCWSWGRGRRGRARRAGKVRHTGRWLGPVGRETPAPDQMVWEEDPQKIRSRAATMQSSRTSTGLEVYFVPRLHFGTLLGTTSIDRFLMRDGARFV